MRKILKGPDTLKYKVVALNDVLKSLDEQSVTKLPQVTSMVGYKVFFRFKSDDYRIGFYFHGKILHLSRILHRKEIYRYFP